MEKERFLGVCILVAAVILAIALVYHAQQASAVGRFQVHFSDPPGIIYTIDTVTGNVESRNR
jgi:hypothetical protein